MSGRLGFKRLPDEPTSEEVDPKEQNSATIIQRHWRRQKVVYGKLGPYNFLRHDGEPADFGSIIFPQNSTPSPFIVCNDQTPAPLLAHLVEKYWHLPRPEVLISVTGGAQEFALPPAVRQAFDRGLAEAANACSAWVLTGGMDAGVMALVAKALTRYECKQPLIAIAPRGAVNGREVFSGQHDRRCLRRGKRRLSARGRPRGVPP